MAIVSISEAARLTGKSRNTLHAKIRTGKLSCVHNDATNSNGIETSELLRVFGSLNSTASTVHKDVSIKQHITQDSTSEVNLIKADLNSEINLLKAKLEEKEKQLKDKQDHIESLKKAMLLLEDKSQKTPHIHQEETKKEGSLSLIKRIFRI